MPRKILNMKSITKSFAGVTVLDNVQFDLMEGEVHALMGENGAGKSTLMKILTGVYTKDSGIVEKLDQGGNMVQMEHITPKEAQEKGISIVFQHWRRCRFSAEYLLFIRGATRCRYLMKDLHNLERDMWERSRCRLY